MDTERIKAKIISTLTLWEDDGKWGNGPDMKPIVLTTAELSIPGEELDYQGGIIIGPNRPGQIMLGVVLAACAAAGITASWPQYPFLLIWPFLSVITSLVLILAFKMFYRPVILDNKGITVNGQSYGWSQIMGTFMMTPGPGFRNRVNPRYVLIIVDMFENVSRYTVNYLSVDQKMLSTMIEYYKAKAANPAASSS